MKILVTGASGFIGRAVVGAFVASQEPVELVATVRNPAAVPIAGVRYVLTDVSAGLSAWKTGLKGVDAVVHCAALVHEPTTSNASLSEYRRANVVFPLQVAREAIEVGVRRFVFISSAKVMGDESEKPFRESDLPRAVGWYAVSKYEAELALQELTSHAGMELVIIRPPLVYGPGVKANFLAMMRAVYQGIPLPLARIQNKRSLVALDNLADFVRTCCIHPVAVNQIFFVSDDEDLSTPLLLQRVGHALGRRARLLSVPTSLLKQLARMTRTHDQLARLTNSMQLDIGKARDFLHWSPIISVDEGIARAARFFLESQR